MAAKRKARKLSPLARAVRDVEEDIQTVSDELHQIQSAVIAHERSITILSDHFEREVRIRDAWRHRLMLDARLLELLLALELSCRREGKISNQILAALDALRAREQAVPTAGASLVTPEGA